MGGGLISKSQRTPADSHRRKLMVVEIMVRLIINYYKHVTAIKTLNFIASNKQ